MERRIEGFPLAALTVVCLAATLGGCFPQRPADVDAEKAELLQLHLADIRAHVDGDVAGLMATIPEDFRMVSDGEVAIRSRAEIEAWFTSYLADAAYTRYEDLQVPHAEVSADGSMGWVISRMAVARSEPDGAGGRRVREFEYAGIMTWEKSGGRWMKVANVSTFAPAAGR